MVALRGWWRMIRTTRGGGGAVGPHAHGNAARHVVGDLNAEGEWAAQTVQRPPQPPAQPPVHQLLGSADTETQQGTPAAAADRKQRPDATCEGQSG